MTEVSFVHDMEPNIVSADKMERGEFAICVNDPDRGHVGRLLYRRVGMSGEYHVDVLGTGQHIHDSRLHLYRVRPLKQIEITEVKE